MSTDRAPDWFLRAGYGSLVVYVVDADGNPVGTERFATASCRAAVPSVEPETRVDAGGGTVEDARIHTAAVEIVGWPQIKTLRRWKREGLHICARLVARGRGRHLIWNERVAVRLVPFFGERGTTEGDALMLSSSVFEAAVESSPDLLELSTWASDTASVILPAPGLRVHAWRPADTYAEGAILDADPLTIEALGSGGGVLLSDTDVYPSLTLPANTVRVRVTGTALAGVRPVLTTYPASAVLGEGGYILGNPDTAEAEMEADLSGYGAGTVGTGAAVNVVIGGTTLGTHYLTLGDAPTRAVRTRETPDGLEIDTLPPLA